MEEQQDLIELTIPEKHKQTYWRLKRDMITHGAPDFKNAVDFIVYFTYVLKIPEEHLITFKQYNKIRLQILRKGAMFQSTFEVITFLGCQLHFKGEGKQTNYVFLHQDMKEFINRESGYMSTSEQVPNSPSENFIDRLHASMKLAYEIQFRASKKLGHLKDFNADGSRKE